MLDEEIDEEGLRRRYKLVRTFYDENQDNFAVRLGYGATKGMLSNYEIGKTRQLPMPVIFGIYMHCHEINFHWFMTGRDEMESKMTDTGVFALSVSENQPAYEPSHKKTPAEIKQALQALIADVDNLEKR